MSILPGPSRASEMRTTSRSVIIDDEALPRMKPGPSQPPSSVAPSLASFCPLSNVDMSGGCPGRLSTRP